MHHNRFRLQAAVVGSFMLFSQTVKSQQNTPVPTLIVGATQLRLGMQKDAVIPVLSAQYVVKTIFPNCKDDEAACRAYTLYNNDNSPVASLQFDRSGSLVKATAERLPGFENHNEGDVGKALVTTLSNFVAEGLHCTIEASTSSSVDLKNPGRLPSMILRQAVVECGNKRLRIMAQKLEGYPDALQLTEEIGCSSEVVGSCEK